MYRRMTTQKTNMNTQSDRQTEANSEIVIELLHLVSILLISFCTLQMQIKAEYART